MPNINYGNAWGRLRSEHERKLIEASKKMAVYRDGDAVCYFAAVDEVKNEALRLLELDEIESEVVRQCSREAIPALGRKQENL